ncbi:MAG: uracil-DNA glycosylase [Planctomycetota bacterium]
MSKRKWNRLRRSVITCQLCPRLIEHCRHVASVKRKAYQDCNYWGRPVPDFGTPEVGLLVVGLAPGAHGANRTGRLFTGDRSGDWLYRSMHQNGFSNQSESTSRKDGLDLFDCTITNVCRCAPPGNKPATDEIENCRPFLKETFLLSNPIVVLALGSVAWTATIKMAIELDWIEKPRKRPRFGHGEKVALNNRWLLGSYHPSQQNTFTGRLTRPMLNSVFRKAKRLISAQREKTG